MKWRELHLRSLSEVSKKIRNLRFHLLPFLLSSFRFQDSRSIRLKTLTIVLFFSPKTENASFEEFRSKHFQTLFRNFKWNETKCGDWKREREREREGHWRCVVLLCSHFLSLSHTLTLYIFSLSLSLNLVSDAPVSMMLLLRETETSRVSDASMKERERESLRAKER